MAVDDFNRADASPIGGSWTTSPGFTGLRIVSNECAKVDSFGGDAAAYYNAVTFANNQYSQYTPTVLGTNTDQGPMVRSATSGTTKNGYIAAMYSPGEELFKFVGGSYTSIAAITTSDAVNTDVIRCEAEGTTIRWIKNGSVQGSTTDSSLASGAAGIFIYRPDCRANNWEGGDLAAAYIPVSFIDGIPAAYAAPYFSARHAIEEYLSAALATGESPVSATLISHLESLAQSAAARVAALEALASGASVRVAPFEALTALASTRTPGLEALLGIGAARTANIEALGYALVAATAVIPIEATGDARVVRVLGVEALAPAARSVGLTIEALLAVTRTADGAIEALARVAVAPGAGLEALVALSGAATLSHEALVAIAFGAGIPIEALQGAVVNSIVNVVERTAYFQIRLSHEARFARSVTDDARFARSRSFNVEF